jgi:hypothetical protein
MAFLFSFAAQADMFAGVVAPEKIAIFHEEIVSAIPAGNFYAVASHFRQAHVAQHRRCSRGTFAGREPPQRGHVFEKRRVVMAQATAMCDAATVEHGVFGIETER